MRPCRRLGCYASGASLALRPLYIFFRILRTTYIYVIPIGKREGQELCPPRQARLPFLAPIPYSSIPSTSVRFAIPSLPVPCPVNYIDLMSCVPVTLNDCKPVSGGGRPLPWQGRRWLEAGKGADAGEQCRFAKSGCVYCWSEMQTGAREMGRASKATTKGYHVGATF